MKATAVAPANIALIKYWGKRDIPRNLPAVGSISITLRDLLTRTSVEFSPEFKADQLRLDGEAAPESQRARVSRFLDRIRAWANFSHPARVVSRNNFPTGAGLASSASGFAALTLAATAAAGLELPPEKLSELARLGSGSAPRSLYGGFVEMKLGAHPDGRDAVAIPLFPPEHLDISMLIAITTRQQKKIGSTEGMERTARTSPYYRAWIETGPADLAEMRRALAQRDFAKIGELAEYSCLKMHGLAFSARPGLIYWNPATIAVMQAVRELHYSGIPAYFTIDAGPQVKVLTLPKHTPEIEALISALPGVERVISTGLGEGARLIDDQSTTPEEP